MPELPPELRQILDRVSHAFADAERQHKAYRPRWDHFFGLWNNYNDTVQQGWGRPRDWDPGQRHWWKREVGAELFIPITFSTVETIVPRAVAQRPRMLVTPRPINSLPAQILAGMEDAARNHQLLLDAQQDALHYELVLQRIARDGFIFGLGVQKTYWKREMRTVFKVEPHIYNGQPCLAEHREAAWDDPFAECIDPFNFFWDPQAETIDTADFAIHRSWRNTKYVLDMVKSGRWGLMPGLTEEDIGRGTGTARKSETETARLKALGLDSAADLPKDLHEVWEFHDGSSVITILDRQWPVQFAKSPTWHGELPFQCFRPTEVPHRFVGKSEVEPIESIQDETNTFRTQRLDNATLTLMQSYAYSEGNVDPADVKFGPGMLIPVVGDPREFLFPIPQGTMPNAGYQEMAEMKADADRTSGISDVSAGADPSGGVSGTATGAQLVENNAGKRIALKARRLEIEIIASGAKQWLAMNQREYALRPRQKRVPTPPTIDQPDRRYTWVTLDEGALAGEFMVAPEGGSSAADNIPQKRSDVQLMAQVMRGDPMFDQQKVRIEMVRKLDFSNPESWLAPPPPPPPDEVPPQALDDIQKALIARGMKPQEAAQILAESVRAARAQQQAQQAQQPQGQPQLPPGQPQPA